ncbi:MAG TPA: PEP/pyruvate-binding domain-containing protein, partial [Myxococcota bacterium]|nr:PEP/pyruvate-binding domain-containing protein [Myxococcota bacterium]
DRTPAMRWTTPIILSVLLACGDPVAPTDTSDAEVSDTVEVDAEDTGEPGDSEDGDTRDGADTGDAGETDVGPGESFLNELSSADDLARLSVEGGEVKYLAPVVGKAPPEPLEARCYFQDMHLFEWHLLFLRSFPGLETLPNSAYTSMVLARGSRVLWGGSVRAYASAIHPRTGKPGVIAYTVYSEALPGSLTAADLVELDATLEGCIPFGRDLLVFVPGDVVQRQLVVTQAQALSEGDVDVLAPEQLRPGLSAESYVSGVGYGTLRIVPPNQIALSYGPRDILIAASAPNDISIVSGLVTRDPQNPHSHVNLRLAEKQVPSASVAAIYDNELVRTYAGKLVRLEVTAATVTLTPATLAEAEAFWESRRPTLPPLTWDLEVEALKGFDVMRHVDAKAYGVKAANLGELYRFLPEENRVVGFGIPFAHYAAFAETPTLKSRIEVMLADPRMKADAVFARTQLAVLREAIEDTPFPPALLDALASRMREVFGEGVDTTRIRFRSSTNAEDLDVISGAGLYDSKSGCLADDLDGDTVGPSKCMHADERAFLEAELAARRAELAAHPERVWLVELIDDIDGDLKKEKPVARAVRKVWASLWNERAYQEREFYGLDHRQVFMGIAVEPSFVLETANVVAVTNLPSDEGVLMRLVSQSGWLSVVRPEDPLAIAEVATALMTDTAPYHEGLEVLVGSSLVPTGETVLSSGELETLAGLLRLVQVGFEAEVYPDLEPLRLDLEIKRTRDGRIVVKQARPYIALDTGPGE